MIAPASGSRRGAALALLIVAGVCALVYWPRLGAEGLRSTEGHRAIPGWEALDGGAWLPTRMFGAAYVRKPPGMPWAVAASSAVFGETEFAARAPSALSATLMALMAAWFGARWFGAGGAAGAGLAQALMPRMWSVGRTADIEALHALGVQAAAFALAELLLARRSGRAWPWALLAGSGLFVAVLAKAHAGLPVVGGVLVAACMVDRSIRPLARPAVWGAIGLCAAAVAPLAWLYWRALGGERAVVEEFSGYLWDSRRLIEAAAFPLAAFASGLPATLALLFAFGPDARREAGRDEIAVERWRVARGLALAFACATLIYWCSGVSNARYALPALALAPPCVGYLLSGWRGGFLPHRRRIARWLMLGHPLAPAALLAAGAGWFILRGEPRDAASSGRPAGLALAPALADGATVWADGMINAKPEVLWYARRDAAAEGRHAAVRWAYFDMRVTAPPPPGVLMVVNAGERSRYEAALGAGALEVLHEGVADTTRFWLVRVLPRGP